MTEKNWFCTLAKKKNRRLHEITIYLLQMNYDREKLVLCTHKPNATVLKSSTKPRKIRHGRRRPYIEKFDKRAWLEEDSNLGPLGGSSLP